MPGVAAELGPVRADPQRHIEKSDGGVLLAVCMHVYVCVYAYGYGYAYREERWRRPPLGLTNH